MSQADWEKIEQLGQGGQGITWLVKLRSEEKVGVMKLLRKTGDKQARARMFREVAALKSLSTLKARVPGVLEDNTGEFEDQNVELYFVMEKIEGKTLRSFVTERGHLSIEESIAATSSLLETLDTGINAEIIHRDIKPENIIVRSNDLNDMVIVDYGLSFNKEDDADDDLTKVDERFDNRFLSLPERRAKGENKRDPRSDITGISGIFYFCLTGHDPVDLVGASGRPPHRREARSLRDTHANATWIAKVDTLFDKAFNPDIAMRFQNVADLGERLKNILRSTTTDGTVQPNLAAYAKRAGEAIRAHDRPTQLANLIRLGSTKWNLTLAYLNQAVHKINQNGFNANAGQTNIEAKTLGVSENFPRGFVFSISFPTKTHIGWQLQYAASVSGNEITIWRYARLFDNSLPPQTRNVKETKWEPIFYYDGTHGLPATYDTDIKDDIERVVAEGLAELVRHALPEAPSIRDD